MIQDGSSDDDRVIAVGGLCGCDDAGWTKSGNKPAINKFLVAAVVLWRCAAFGTVVLYWLWLLKASWYEAHARQPPHLPSQ